VLNFNSLFLNKKMTEDELNAIRNDILARMDDPSYVVPPEYRDDEIISIKYRATQDPRPSAFTVEEVIEALESMRNGRVYSEEEYKAWSEQMMRDLKDQAAEIQEARRQLKESKDLSPEERSRLELLADVKSSIARWRKRRELARNSATTEQPSDDEA
jgi:DNA repair exonuclease SbcCD ATPase subunit